MRGNVIRLRRDDKRDGSSGSAAGTRHARTAAGEAGVRGARSIDESLDDAFVISRSIKTRFSSRDLRRFADSAEIADFGRFRAGFAVHRLRASGRI
jgi:hypothetical protein